MNNLISLKILTPEKTIYEDEVLKVSVNTESGEIGILPDHMPLVSLIKAGEIRIEKDKNLPVIPFSIDTGVLEVRPSNKDKNQKSEVIILASRSEIANEIDIKRAEDAYERAKIAMEETENISDIDFARFQAMMEKEFNRIKVAKKYKN